MGETPRFTSIAVYWYKFIDTQKCNHRTLKPTSSRTAKPSSTALRKQRGWDKELHCYRPKNGRHVSWRSEIYIFTHGFRMFQGRSENWFWFTSSQIFQHVSTCWSSTSLDFPPSFSEPPKKTKKTLSEGLRLLGTCPWGWNQLPEVMWPRSFGPWELSKLVQLQVWAMGLYMGGFLQWLGCGTPKSSIFHRGFSI